MITKGSFKILLFSHLEVQNRTARSILTLLNDWLEVRTERQHWAQPHLLCCRKCATVSVKQRESR